MYERKPVMPEFDHKRVNGAVNIKIALDRTLSRRKCEQLNNDLTRLKSEMTTEERNEYNKRIA